MPKKYYSLILILFITTLPYLSSLNNNFVSYDDPALIYENPAVTNFDLKKILLSENAADFLPLTTLSFAIENKVFGLDPFYFHLDNLILHLLNVSLVFLFINLIIPEPIFIALLTALLFGIHPLHVESVAWVSQRKDVLSTFFYLISLIFYLRSTQRKNLINYPTYLCSLLFFLFSISAKFMAVSLPGIIILFELTKSEKIKVVARKSLPFILITLFFSVIHLNLHDSTSRAQSENHTILVGIKNGFDSLAFYLTKSIAPFNLSAFYEKGVADSGILEYSFFVGWLFLVGLAIKLKCRVSHIFLFNLFFLATIFPVLQIIPFGNKFIFADRFMYLPSIGLFSFFSIIIFELFKFKYFRLPVYFLLILLTALFTYLSFNQTINWKNSKSLWSAAIKIYPDSSFINNNLADELIKEGNTEAALDLLKKAIKLDPGYSEPHANLALLYMDKNDFEKAKDELKTSLEINPKDYKVYFNLGSLAQKQNDFNLALDNYKKSVQLKSDFADGYLNMSSALYKLNQKEESKATLEKLIKLNPNLPEAHNNLGYLYFEQEKYKEAETELVKAIALDKYYDQPHRTLALIYFKNGAQEKGQEEIQRVISINEYERLNPSRKRRN